jgi:hypothetical protein
VNTDKRRESQHVDTNGGDSNFYNKLRKPGLELETLGQFTYTYQHPHSPVTNQGRRAAAARTGTGDGHGKSQHVDIKGGNNNFYNKLRKPGLELETLGSDTMLSFMH